MMVDNELGFDCASQNEIKQTLSMGVDSANIIYSNSIKNEQDIVYADSVGV